MHCNIHWKEGNSNGCHSNNGWNNVSQDEITVSEISGGITNLLWKLTPPLKSGLGPVVVRVFGEQTDLLIDRDREKEVLLQLNQAGFGAPILSTFDNGRVEAFLDMRTLTPEDMTHPAMAVRIARRLKQFHNAPITLHDSNVGRAEPFSTLWKWLNMAKMIHYEDGEKQKAHEAVDIGAMEIELALTEGKSTQLGSPIVWSHNDLLSGNVLVSKQEMEPRGDVGTMPSMQFIDFEYGCHSYRGYDWGNHFCEYAGFECAYNRYPDKEHIALFVRAYLNEGSTSPPADEEVEAAVAEANFFALVSHQFWGIWALIQARYSPIDFDYFSYSKLRWDEYYRRKDEFLSAVEPFLRK
ncbi:probable ethanolamine kinase [Coccomyxa sp. Obi]|nr:probable ethanolamine kinase [Coccomyxa sp. Obi]